VNSTVFALSFHADYKCRHSGACCTADWDVPVELPVYRSLADAVAEGRLSVTPDAQPLAPFIVEPGLPEEAAAIIDRTERGDCVFFERGTHLCVVHRDLGDTALPATCRHFPRVAVRDGRGTFITLSHFCPTAASMLFRDDVPTRVIEGPDAFPPAGYEGLIVTGDDLPPLLAPRRLMDLEGYTAWERHMIERCAGHASPESVVATLVRDARILRVWKPGAETLAQAVAGLPREYEAAPRPEALAGSLALHRDVMCAVPDDLRPVRDESGLDDAYRRHVRDAWPAFAAPLNRYLAAKAFASWTAYQGRGIATIVRGLEVALALVRVEASRQSRDAARALDRELTIEAIRGADFALNHLAVGEDLAQSWSRVEHPVASLVP
jgi:Fe-S-cluster containining protein